MLPDVGQRRVILDLAALQRLRPALLVLPLGCNRRTIDGRQSGCYAPDPGPSIAHKARGAGLAFSSFLRFEQGRLNPSSRFQEPSPPATDRARGAAWVGIAVLLVALAPALAALAAVPWFVTQDGPAHLYNAEILARSFDADSPFRESYRGALGPVAELGGTPGAGRPAGDRAAPVGQPGDQCADARRVRGFGPLAPLDGRRARAGSAWPRCWRRCWV